MREIPDAGHCARGWRGSFGPDFIRAWLQPGVRPEAIALRGGDGPGPELCERSRKELRQPCRR